MQKVLFLDQNKWIELARVHSGKHENSLITQLLDQLFDAVQSNRLVVPLTMANVIETSKRSDIESRRNVACLQIRLSRGLVYFGRRHRIKVEIRAALATAFGGDRVIPTKNWSIAPSIAAAFYPGIFEGIESHIDPVSLYRRIILGQDDNLRRESHRVVSIEIAELLSRVESRRKLWSSYSKEIRLRAYYAILFLENQDEIVSALAERGQTMADLRALGDLAMRKLLVDIPTLDIEARMVVWHEEKTGEMKPNDLLDVESFCSVIPQEAYIVAEKHFISIAKRAKLHERYKIQCLSSKLEDLLGAFG